ncbi:MAG: prenyltransferase/squalene oxidase repeat-containing protein [Solirubrobacteraceae bacterium]
MTVTVLSIYPACSAQAATARDPGFQPNLEATVRYLQNVQRENGGFAEPGTEPESDFTAWITLALAAAGINPRDQTTEPQHWVDGHSAYTYLVENAHKASLTTDFERELLVVDAAGTSPHNFGGVDLTGEILKRQIATGGNTGAFPHVAGSQTPGVNDTIFAILSLSPIHEPAVEEAVGRATQWLEAQQKCDGSWYWMYRPRVNSCNPKERRLLPGEEGGEIDMAGAALEALNAVKHPDLEGQGEAFEYLREGETPNGGFVEFITEGEPKEPNAASTAWVVQAMWSAGINPETWTTVSRVASDEPLGYLASMQQPDGHIRYEASKDLNDMWMTAYVTPAFTGNPLPIPAAPYVPLPVEPPGSGESRNGGVSAQPGGGVIAGGGGNGAPLFSRPQPGSKGHTPGGARQLEEQHHNTIKHRRNPGAARKTPVLTVTTASVHRAKKHDPVSHKGTGGVALTGTGTGGGTQSSGKEVKGILIGAPADALEPGAPGLRGARAGDNQTPWPAIGIAGALLLSVVIGAGIEGRRPEVIL